MTVLNVGSDQQFQHIADAIRASQDGDVVNVQAGTYVNDFATIDTKISINGIGGMAHLLATVAPPDGKAILTTNTDLSIDHLELRVLTWGSYPAALCWQPLRVGATDVCGWIALQAVRKCGLREERSGAGAPAVSLSWVQVPFHRHAFARQAACDEGLGYPAVWHGWHELQHDRPRAGRK